MHALLAGHLFENEDNLNEAITTTSGRLTTHCFGERLDALVRIYSEQQKVDDIVKVFEAASVHDPIGLADALDAGRDRKGRQDLRQGTRQEVHAGPTGTAGSSTNLHRPRRTTGRASSRHWASASPSRKTRQSAP